MTERPVRTLVIIVLPPRPRAGLQWTTSHLFTNAKRPDLAKGHGAEIRYGSMGGRFNSSISTNELV